MRPVNRLASIRRAYRIILILGTITAGVGCSTTSPSPKPSETGTESSSQTGAAASPQDFNPAQAISDSTLDITYVRGHNLHRFFAQARSETIKAQSFMDRQLLKEGVVDKSRYGALIQRVATFVSTARRQTASPGPASASPCRSPFTVKLRIGSETQTANGCRSSDEGGENLGRITRDAEFLLYSQK